MEIVLIRHAKTEKKREDLEDIRRYLTEKGKDKFKKSVPNLKEKLEPLSDRKIILWSSPAMRAFETAHLVAHGLEIDIDAVQGFIYEGDFEKLSKAVQKIEDETTLLVVGHEPYLSEWTEEMSGEAIEIAIGDMLSFKVTQQIPLEADLQWVLSSK